MDAMAHNANTAQARHTTRLTQAQKDALLKAHLLDGVNVRECQRMARRGELDTPAFEIGDYAYDVIKHGRESFEERHPEALAKSTRAAIRRLHKRNLAKARALDGSTDPAENARVAKALAETYKAVQATEARPNAHAKAKAEPGYNQGPEPSDAPKTDDPLSNLLAMTGAAPKSGSLARAPKGLEPSAPLPA